MGRQGKGKIRKRALSVIDSIFALASHVGNAFPELLKRYSYLARRVARKNGVRLFSEHKRRICKHCKVYLTPSVNCRVRLRSKHKNIVYYCFSSKKYSKLGYSVTTKQ